jgi:hypothetical protein
MSAKYLWVAGTALICTQLGFAGLTASGLHAQTVKDSSAPGRFAAVPTANGVLRLDSQTGSVSLCTTRLSKENADLRTAAASHAPPVSAPPQASARSNLPGDAEVDRALNIMERFVQRMMRIMKEDPSNNPI